ncbi:hypothetical protein AVEN_41792-1 [Araneus ventricosus]|uniref:Uncharacterized protein n=1 Tax=Araneus ventricosus TaxID=182803 RepID=A0A4Y2ACP0_ARAVE|nr:hypothetical protein AVEN_41792-1 [Araneus ventricosus]
MGGWVVAPNFPLELLQQFLSFESSMGIVMRRVTPSLNMPGRLRRMASRWLNSYFLFPKLKEHLSETRFSSNSELETSVENWLSRQGSDLYQSGVKQVGPAFK